MNKNEIEQKQQKKVEKFSKLIKIPNLDIFNTEIESILFIGNSLEDLKSGFTLIESYLFVLISSINMAQIAVHANTKDRIKLSDINSLPSVKYFTKKISKSDEGKLVVNTAAIAENTDLLNEADLENMNEAMSKMYSGSRSTQMSRTTAKGGIDTGTNYTYLRGIASSIAGKLINNPIYSIGGFKSQFPDISNVKLNDIYSRLPDQYKNILTDIEEKAYRFFNPEYHENFLDDLSAVDGDPFKTSLEKDLGISIHRPPKIITREEEIRDPNETGINPLVKKRRRQVKQRKK